MNIQGFSPAIAAPVLGTSANAVRPAATSSSAGTSGTSSTGSTGNGTSSSSLESTFLNLLVTELQNQDPTQPVDPTEMVGQMVSLNQLDQLISINQTLTNMTGTSTTGTSTSGGTGTTGNSGTGSTRTNHSVAPNMQSANSNPLATTFPAAASQLPAAAPGNGGYPGLMNLYGNMTNSKSNPYPTYTGVR